MRTIRRVLWPCAVLMCVGVATPTAAQGVTASSRVSSVEPTNYPCAAPVTMTVIGPGELGQVHQGFGSLPSALKIRMQGSACDSTLWLSASSAVCKTTTAGFDASDPAFRGQIVLTMQTNVQLTLKQAFSFDMPVVNATLNSNGPAGGGEAMVTISGVNFGSYSFSTAQSIQVGLSSCVATDWTSDSALACRLASGVAGFLPIVTSIGSQYNGSYFLGPRLASRKIAFSYDVALLAKNISYNGAPTALNLVLTAAGINFGLHDYSAMGTLGNTAAEMTRWTSDTGLMLGVAAGSRDGLALFLTVGGLNLTQGGAAGNASVGTTFGAFTYDIPLATSGSKVNVPANVADELSAINITGANFGAADLTAGARVGVSACSVTQWRRDDVVTCRVVAGIAASLSALITLDLIVGSGLEEMVSYDRPFLGNSSTANYPSLGYSPTFAAGVMWNFSSLGLFAATAGARGGGSACPETVWTSDTALTTRFAAGVQGSLSFVTTVAQSVGSSDASASFDVLVLSGLLGSNAAAGLGGGVLGLSGSEFGRAAYSGAGRLASTACEATDWVAETVVSCAVPLGIIQANASSALSLTIMRRWNTASIGFTYDGPGISSMKASNAPVVGASLTISGLNFGAVDYSATATAGQTAAESSVWISDSNLALKAASGAGAQQQASLTVGGGNSSLLALSVGREGVSVARLTYDSPMVLGAFSMLSPDDPLGPGSNGPMSETSNMTASFNLTTVSLGVFDLSSGSRLGGTSSTSSAWLSDTVIATRLAPQSSGRFLGVVITTGLGFGSGSGVYSFDAPTITNVSGNMVAMDVMTSNRTVTNAPGWSAAEAKQELVLYGINFGTISSSVSSRAGATACLTTEWSSSSSVIARLPGLVVGSAAMVATLALGIGTQAQALEIDAPVVSTITNRRLYMGYAQWESNLPRVGGAVLSVFGSGMGFYASSASARLSATSCSSTLWVSSSQVQCSTSSGRGELMATVVSVGVRKGTASGFVSYDMPAVSLIMPANAPPRAAVALIELPAVGQVVDQSIVTVVGNNFHVIDTSPTVRVGRTTCLASAWSSDSSILCSLAPGYGYGSLGTDAGSEEVEVRFAGTNMTTLLTTALTYDAPVISALTPASNSSQLGRFGITLLGLSFGNFKPPSGVLHPSTNRTCSSANALFEVAIGDTACATSTWTSDSATACRGAPAGVGKVDVSLRMCNRSTLQPRNNSLNSTDTRNRRPYVFKYASPSLTPGVCTVNIGTNGSNVSNTSNDSDGSAFLSTSEISCGPLGARVNGATVGGDTITLLGASFGPWDSTVRVRVGDTAAATISWISGSAVTCLSRHGPPGTSPAITLTVAGSEASTMGAFSFDAAVVTGVSPVRLIHTDFHLY